MPGGSPSRFGRAEQVTALLTDQSVILGVDARVCGVECWPDERIGQAEAGEHERTWLGAGLVLAAVLAVLPLVLAAAGQSGSAFRCRRNRLGIRSGVRREGGHACYRMITAKDTAFIILESGDLVRVLSGGHVGEAQAMAPPGP